MSSPARELLAAKAIHGISVALRTTRIEDGRQVIDLWPISSPSEIARITEFFGPQCEFMSSVSLVALDTPTWSDCWLPSVRAAGEVTVLIDSPPVDLFDRWHMAGVGCEAQALLRMDSRFPTAAAMFIGVPRESPTTHYVAVCSPHCADSLRQYASSSPSSQVSELWNANSASHLLLDITAWHLLFEEPWFDFYAAPEADDLHSDS